VTQIQVIDGMVAVIPDEGLIATDECPGCHCDDDEGACCLPDGSCEQRTRSSCLAAGGEFAGAGIDCEDVICPDDGPCTDEGCPNGFVDAFGDPQPSPLVGCTRNSEGEPDTCLFTVFDMSVEENPPFKANPNPGTDFDPRMEISENYSAGRTDCASNPAHNVSCCGGQMGFNSGTLNSYEILPSSGLFVTTQMSFTASATTNGAITFSAQYETSNPSSFRVFGTLNKTQVQVVEDPIFWRQTIGLNPLDTETFTGSMVPIFLVGAGGIQQVVGAEIQWTLIQNRTVFSDFGNPLPYVTTFTGSATVRLLNLRRYDPDCNEQAANRLLVDPRAIRVFDQQLRGGGCHNCGDGWGG
jgi:hypothetical protein